MTAATLHHPRYRLDRLIATGGMGEVWSATDTLLDREVAVKVLKREYAEDPVFRARFAAEARHAGSLQHPHVAAVLDYGELDMGGAPAPFLVMELVEGRSLSALLAAGQPLEPELATELVAQAAEGLGAAHVLGIVHRDVKPGNLLLTEDGRLKVTDFGVARAADTVPLTVTGHIVGTPHYLSPEQAQGEPATSASDVYSLGIVLYECLVGQRPFSGDSPIATALMQVRDPLPPFPRRVPRRLQDIVRVATAKDPAARYSTAAAFAAALRDQTPDTRTFVIPETAASTPASARGGPRFPAVLRGLVVVAALLVLGIGGWAMGFQGDDEDAAPPRGSQPELVRVSQSALLGMPVDRAADRLDDRGFRVRRVQRDNPGERAALTVAAVAPSGLVERGAWVTLTYWGRPPAPEPTGDTATGGAGPSAGGASRPGSAGAEDRADRSGQGGQQPPHAGKAHHSGKDDHSGKSKGKSHGKGHKGGPKGGAR